MKTCSFCKSRGDKGYFGYPKEEPQRGDCLKIAGLPAEEDLKGKVENLKICFRHYKTKAFFLNDGGQLRLKKGKVVVQNFIFEVSDLVQSVRDLLLLFSKYRAHYIHHQSYLK